MEPAQFVVLCYNAFTFLKDNAPVDTGNLAFNSIQIEFTGDKKCTIYVDESIAEYMPYTNEVWLSNRWHGKRNPNQNWFDFAVEKIVSMLAEITNGTVTVGKKQFNDKDTIYTDIYDMYGQEQYSEWVRKGLI